ncbi:putative DUF1064 protein [Salipiger abyssi]|uniref:Putative DUF1064 protein n=1 Tax=Salipiger abyssi TaxID=1250539 RepID=A0A1P8UUP1_9RHOB|nr:putative DUF1064 protein [Salipiger abyssi]
MRGTKRKTVDGITFDSTREANRYAELKLLEKTGDIASLELQPLFELHGKNGPIMTDSGQQQRVYHADFRYIDWRLNGVWVVEDVKGFATDKYKLVRAILAAQGVDIVEV